MLMTCNNIIWHEFCNVYIAFNHQLLLLIKGEGSWGYLKAKLIKENTPLHFYLLS